MNLPDNMTLQATLASGNKEAAQKSFMAEGVAWVGRIAILLAVVVSPWLVGSVHHSAQFWIAIAALIGLAFWWFETAIYKKEKQYLPYVVAPVILGLGIGLLQMVPLPDGVADVLLGRQAEIYERYTVDGRVIVDESNISNSVKKRISLNQEETMHNVQLIMIAIAGLLLGCRLFRSRRDIFLFLSAVTINGFALTIFGVIQRVTTDGRSTIYWSIPLTQGGIPFGPFVNRNNAAGYLLMCLAAAIGLMAIVAEQRRTVGPNQMVSREIPFWRQLQLHLLYFFADLTATKLAVILSVIAIATGVMATLSRGGVIALLAASVVTLVFYGMARKPKHAGILLFPLILLVGGLTAFIGFGPELLERFEGLDTNELAAQELRFTNWKDTFPATQEMGLLGSGLGTYSGVHRLYRSDREERLFQFAENNYFQAWVEAGWPGLVLYIVAWCIAWSYAMLLIYRGTSATTVGPGIACVFLISSQAVASFFDYGLYMPANMLLAAAFLGFVAYQAHSLAGRLKKKTWLRLQIPNSLVQVVLLVTFAGVTIAALDLYRHSQLDAAMKYKIRHQDYESLDLEQTNAAIEKISPLVKRTTSIEGLNYLGDLYVHRSRLQFFDKLVAPPTFQLMEAEERQKTNELFWNQTLLIRMQENLEYLKQQVSHYSASRFLQEDFIIRNLPVAMNYYSVSRQLSPLQPQVQRQLGLINSLIGGAQAASADFERSVELAPTNAELRMAAGLFYLQAGQLEDASRHFRRFLELAPEGFKDLMAVLTGRAGLRINPVDETVIFSTIIPDDPKMLFDFAMRYMDASSPHKLDVLDRADLAVGDASLSNRDLVLLSGQIKLEKGDIAGGVQRFEDALRSEPGDQEVRIKLARLYLETGNLLQAKKLSDYLVRINRRDDAYIKLEKDVKAALDALEEVERTKSKD